VRKQKQKNHTTEIGLEFLFEVLLFLYPYGADQMGLPHLFWLGLAAWASGFAVAIRIFWIFPPWANRLNVKTKSTIAIIASCVFMAVLWNPVNNAYHRGYDHRDFPLAKPISSTESNNPPNAKKETPVQRTPTRLPRESLNAGPKPIEVSLNCYDELLPITIGPDEIGRVIGFSEGYSKATQNAPIREIVNREANYLTWPDLKSVQDAVQKYGQTEKFAWRCEVLNHGQENVLDLSIPLHVFYNFDSSKVYPVTAVLNPLDHGKRINFYLINICPTEVQIQIPTSGTARLAGEQSLREFNFEQSQPGIHGFQLGPVHTNWTGTGCD
jgi:hypothetical protein